MASLAGIDAISAQCGQTLTVEERAALDIGMQKRLSGEGLASISVWGKVSGTGDDYLIAVGVLPSKTYPKKKFYFATSKDLTLKAFPDLDDDFTSKAAAVTGRFSGDPSKLLGGEEDEDEKDDDEEEGDRPPKFSEVHRLAYAVGQIDAATSLVPRGAFIVDALHNVRANASFSGLTPAQAGSLENYFHWRQPFALERKTALERAGLVQGVDFLDPASEDSVKGAWVVRVDRARGQASLRNLQYPGYFLVHSLNSGSTVSAYMGDGLENADVGFML